MAIGYTNKAKNVACICPQCGKTQQIDLTQYEIEEGVYPSEEKDSGRRDFHQINITDNLPCGHKIETTITLFEYADTFEDLDCDSNIFDYDELMKCFRQ